MTGRTLPILALVLAACSGEPATPPAEDPAPTELQATLVPLGAPTAGGAMAPGLAPAASGFHLTWLEPLGTEERAWRFAFAGLEEGRWDPPATVVEGGDFFANWADRPGLVEVPGGQLFAHRLAMLGEGTYAYGIELWGSSDRGGTWRNLGWLHDDTTPTEHGFVSYAIDASDGDATTWAFWLDGRELDPENPEAGGSMHLRAARLGPEGAEPSELLDERVCDCCPTSAAVTRSGPIVAYRDRSDTEVRDVAVIRRTSEGWSEPALVHADGWQIHGCPVNGPAIAARGDDVAVAWFTAAGETPRVLLAFSEDGGTSFGEPITLDDAQPAGRVDLALDPRGRAWVVWLATAGEAGEIRLQRVDPEGSPGPPVVLTKSTLRRSSGYPRLLLAGEELYLAWVDDAKPSQIRVARIESAEIDAGNPSHG